MRYPTYRGIPVKIRRIREVMWQNGDQYAMWMTQVKLRRAKGFTPILGWKNISQIEFDGWEDATPLRYLAYIARLPDYYWLRKAPGVSFPLSGAPNYSSTSLDQFEALEKLWDQEKQ